MSLALSIAGCLVVVAVGCGLLGWVVSRYRWSLFKHGGRTLGLLLLPGVWLGLPLAVANLTDMPGGFWNTLGVLAVTVPPAYLLIVFFGAGEPSPGASRSTKTFAAYRPVTLAGAEARAPVPLAATGLSLLGALLIVLGCVGVRWSGHLHAGPRVAELPRDFGMVALNDTEGNAVATFASARLRPGEAACTHSVVAPHSQVLMTTPDRQEPYRLTVDASGLGIPERVVETVEDAWVCSAYVREPLTFAATKEMVAAWEKRPPTQ